MGSGGNTATGVSNILHATTVAHANRAVLIHGAAGSGKSTLALQMIALGARLVADDRTIVTRKGTALIASCPETTRGRIEARGMGILAAPISASCQVTLVVDMDTEETERIPPLRQTEIHGIALPLQRKVDLPHFPAAILSYLEHGRLE